MIAPHGGTLIEQYISTINTDLPAYALDADQIREVKNIARGAYSPLTGFLRQADFTRVVEEMRLVDGTVWSIPVVLDAPESFQSEANAGSDILLTDSDGTPIAELRNIERYQFDPDHLCSNVYLTTDKDHPGVRYTYEMHPWLIGGDIWLYDNAKTSHDQYELTPSETRALFAGKGRETVVAFQTRNPPHRGHEYIQRCALEQVDGLFIQPVLGTKKSGDFKDDYIFGAYEILLDNYFGHARTALGALPLKMRYAGPREAVFHATVRQNFGCTHMIVGRDHA